MERICEKCKEVPIEEHHLWCKYLDNPHGYSYKKYENRIFLCRSCHQNLHKVILKVLHSYRSPFSIKSLSENINWKRISVQDREEVIDKIVKESWRWLHSDT